MELVLALFALGAIVFSYQAEDDKDFMVITAIAAIPLILLLALIVR